MNVSALEKRIGRLEKQRGRGGSVEDFASVPSDELEKACEIFAEMKSGGDPELALQRLAVEAPLVATIISGSGA